MFDTITSQSVEKKSKHTNVFPYLFGFYSDFREMRTSMISI